MAKKPRQTRSEYNAQRAKLKLFNRSAALAKREQNRQWRTVGMVEKIFSCINKGCAITEKELRAMGRGYLPAAKRESARKESDLVCSDGKFYRYNPTALVN